MISLSGCIDEASRVPGINQWDAAGLEVSDVSRDDGQVVREGGGRDEGISVGRRVRNVEGRREHSYLLIDRQDTSPETLAQLVDPGPEPLPLGGVTPHHTADTHFDLKESDRRQIEVGGVPKAQPTNDLWVGALLAEFTDHVGVEQIHQNLGT